VNWKVFFIVCRLIIRKNDKQVSCHIAGISRTARMYFCLSSRFSLLLAVCLALLYRDTMSASLDNKRNRFDDDDDSDDVSPYCDH